MIETGSQFYCSLKQTSGEGGRCWWWIWDSWQVHWNWEKVKLKLKPCRQYKYPQMSPIRLMQTVPEHTHTPNWQHRRHIRFCWSNVYHKFIFVFHFRNFYFSKPRWFRQSLVGYHPLASGVLVRVSFGQVLPRRSARALSAPLSWPSSVALPEHVVGGQTSLLCALDSAHLSGELCVQLDLLQPASARLDEALHRASAHGHPQESSRPVRQLPAHRVGKINSEARTGWGGPMRAPRNSLIII